MRLTARKVLMFGLKLSSVLVLFALGWSYFAPTYNSFVAMTATELARLIGTSIEVTEVTADLIKLTLHFPHQKVKIEYEYEGYFHFNLGLLLALFTATPFLKPSQTLRLTMIALGFLIIFHILFLITSARILDPCVQGIFRCPGKVWYHWLDWFMAVSKNLFPVFLWALLTFHYWFPKPAVTTSAPAPQKKRRTKEARP